MSLVMSFSALSRQIMVVFHFWNYTKIDEGLAVRIISCSAVQGAQAFCSRLQIQPSIKG